jgi:hypothetical protein
VEKEKAVVGREAEGVGREAHGVLKEKIEEVEVVEREGEGVEREAVGVVPKEKAEEAEGVEREAEGVEEEAEGALGPPKRASMAVIAESELLPPVLKEKSGVSEFERSVGVSGFFSFTGAATGVVCIICMGSKTPIPPGCAG